MSHLNTLFKKTLVIGKWEKKKQKQRSKTLSLPPSPPPLLSFSMSLSSLFTPDFPPVPAYPSLND